MTKYIINTTIIIFLLGIIGCDATNRPTADKLFLIPLGDGQSYDLKSPVEKYFLPYVLEEISGLSHIDNGLLACVQDENGKVFFYDTKERKITKSIKFSNSGDYEGIEVINDTAYVVSSNGDMFEFSIQQREPDVVVYKTPLSKKNDIEGLGYDPMTNSLLIACKDNSDLDKKKIDGKAIFSFNRQDHKMDKKPIFSITKKDIKLFFESNKDGTYDEKRINFKPSGIALHPIQNKYYVLASVGKMLLVVNRNGQIEASYPIAPRLLGQPEGICFAPNGDMFISSEGEGDKGYILKFEMN